jgi:hypothetical protein
MQTDGSCKLRPVLKYTPEGGRCEDESIQNINLSAQMGTG